MKPTPTELALIAAALANTHNGDDASLMARAESLWNAAAAHLNTPPMKFYDFLGLALFTPQRRDERRKLFMDFLIHNPREWPSAWQPHFPSIEAAAQKHIDDLIARGIPARDVRRLAMGLKEWRKAQVSKSKAKGPKAKARKAKADKMIRQAKKPIHMDPTAAEEMKARQQTGRKPRQRSLADM